MEKIVSNLHVQTPECSLMFDIAEQVEKKASIVANPICNIVAENLTIYADDLLCKASLALRESMKSDNKSDAEKYRGIAEGLCYALDCAIGLPFDVAYLTAFSMATKTIV